MIWNGSLDSGVWINRLCSYKLLGSKIDPLGHRLAKAGYLSWVNPHRRVLALANEVGNTTRRRNNNIHISLMV